MDNANLIVGDFALTRLEVHPLALLVPPSKGVDVRKAIDHPVVLLDGAILDGRARVREAVRLGLPCPCVHHDGTRDDHPALVIARAMADRVPDAYVRAIVCARLVRCILHRPSWLARYDCGFSARLKVRKNLTDLLDACSISIRTYDRAHRILRDELIEGEVVNGLLSLKTAERLFKVPASRRARLVHLPDEERDAAIDRYLARSIKRHLKLQRSFEGMN